MTVRILVHLALLLSAFSLYGQPISIRLMRNVRVRVNRISKTKEHYSYHIEGEGDVKSIELFRKGKSLKKGKNFLFYSNPENSNSDYWLEIQYEDGSKKKIQFFKELEKRPMALDQQKNKYQDKNQKCLPICIAKKKVAIG